MSTVDFGVFEPDKFLDGQMMRAPHPFVSQSQEVREYAVKMLHSVDDPDASVEFRVKWHIEETVWHAEWAGEGGNRWAVHSEFDPRTGGVMDRGVAAQNADYALVCKKYRFDPNTKLAVPERASGPSSFV